MREAPGLPRGNKIGPDKPAPTSSGLPDGGVSSGHLIGAYIIHSGENQNTYLPRASRPIKVGGGRPH